MPRGVCGRLRYKDEYAEAIREIEAVKSEMEAVKQKASTTAVLSYSLGFLLDRVTPGSAVDVGVLAATSVLLIPFPLPTQKVVQLPSKTGCGKPCRAVSCRALPFYRSQNNRADGKIRVVVDTLEAPLNCTDVPSVHAAGFFHGR